MAKIIKKSRKFPNVPSLDIELQEIINQINSINDVPIAIVHGIPVGGTTGQSLTKIDNIDFNTNWTTVSGGGGEVNTASNVGTGTGNVYKTKVGVDLEMRTLLAGSGISIATGINEVTISASGSPYNDSEAQAYFARLSTPLSAGQQTKISNLVIALKGIFQTNALNTVFDFLTIFGNETSEASTKNIIKNAHDATIVNSMTWTQWQGFTGNASNMYLDMNYNPSTQGVTFKRDEASLGLYIRNAGSNGTYVDMGAAVGASGIMLWTNGTLFMRLNGTGGGTTDSGSDKRGFYGIVRGDTYNERSIMYRPADITKITNTDTSVARVNLNIYVGAWDTGSPSFNTDRQYSYAFMGGYMNDDQIRAVKTVMEAYLVSVGTGIL